MPARSTNRLALFLPALALLSWGRPAPAEEPVLPEAPSHPPWPGVRAVGFVDRGLHGHCNELDARLGRCVEWVDFIDPESLYITVDPSPLDQATLHPGRPIRLGPGLSEVVASNVSDVHTELWQNAGWRWEREGDAWGLTAGAAGFSSPPPVSMLFDAGTPSARRRIGLPDRTEWLGADFWGLAGPAPEGTTQMRPVRNLTPSGMRSVPPTVLLRGRTASRLGFSGQAHPWDVMDADPKSSAPFFEQMFPYSMGMESQVLRLRPLLRFATPTPPPTSGESPEDRGRLELELHKDLILESSTLDSMANMAGREFDLLFRAIGIQVLRFGLHDYTVNQMRVLGALTAMAFPPPGDIRDGAGGRNLVAAALGETDADQDVRAKVDRGSWAHVDTGVRVRYEQLPDPVVRLWIDRLGRSAALPDGFVTAWNQKVDGLFSELLKPGHPLLVDLDPRSLQNWGEASLLPGLDPKPILEEVRKVALKQLVAEIPAGLPGEERRRREANRDQWEAWLLLDHVHHELHSSTNTSAGAPATPDEWAMMATAQWQAVLAMHGNYPTPIPQGLGAIDPLSVCTTQDGRKALAEPVLKPVDVDLLVTATAGLKDVQELLWLVREDVPFVAMDEPRRSAPTMEQLVSLPGQRAIYRVRFHVWTGWHVLWSPAAVGDGSRTRLVARTAAFCEDTALAPPGLVPTLVRAALLDGELRPSWPVSVKTAAQQPRGEPLPPDEPADNDTAVAAAQAKTDESAAQASAAKEAATKIREGGPGAAMDVATGGTAVMVGKEAEGLVRTPVGRRTSYLRSLIRPHINRLLQPEGGGTVLVFDTTLRADSAPPDEPPRTPYVRFDRPVTLVQSLAPAGETGGARGTERTAKRTVHTAGWGTWVSEAGDWDLVAPHFRPDDSVLTADPRPKWHRQTLLDGFLMIGGALAPLRGGLWSCTPGALDPAIAACAPTGFVQLGPGLGFDMSLALTSWTLRPTPVAIEFGPEIRLDMGLPSSASSTYGGNFDTVFTLQPSIGLAVGLRFQPPPAGRILPRGLGWPWGADRSDGHSHVERVAWGIRIAFLLGPASEGPAASLQGEWWLGGAIRRADGRRAAITPFRPGALIGPFARFAWSFPAAEDDGLKLIRNRHAFAGLVGVRFHLRMLNPTLFKAPEVK